MSHVKVCVRVKPNAKDAPPSDFLTAVEEPPMLIVKRTGKGKAEPGDFSDGMYQFTFTNVLEDCTNQRIYDEAASGVVASVVEGKTFTMLGAENTPLDHPITQGVIPRALAALFSEHRRNPDIMSLKVSLSYVELYQEEFYDLLSSSRPSSAAANGKPRANRADKIEVKENSTTKNVWLSNVTPTEVPTLSAALALVNKAQANRAIGSHALNDRSSRSHTILSIIVEILGADGTQRRGKLNLVDLAGSERIKDTGAQGKRAAEGAQINTSLLHLRGVVQALANKAPHVPYRNSGLTHFLSDSLGGNCKTTLIACIWGDESKAADSINTCQFAQNMMKVEEHAKKNKDFVAGPGSIVHLSPAVQKIMNAMIEMRLAQAAKLNAKGGQAGMSEEDRAEMARNEATIKALHEEVRREEARARALESKAEQMRLEIEAERAQLAQQQRDLELERQRNAAILSEKGAKHEDQSKENERLRQLLEQNQLLLKEKEEELKRQAEAARQQQESIPAEVQLDNESLMARMKQFSALQKELRAKKAEQGALSEEEEEQLMYLREDLIAMRLQLGLSMSPSCEDASEAGMASPFAPDRNLSESEDASDYINSPTNLDSPDAAPVFPGTIPRGFNHSSSRGLNKGFLSRRSSVGSVDSNWIPPADEDDPNYAPSGLKKTTFMKRMFSGSRKSKNEGSTLTAKNLADMQAAKTKPPDSIVILARLDHKEYLEELKNDGQELPSMPSNQFSLENVGKLVRRTQQ